MKRLILIAVVLSVGCAVAGWRGRFDEQFAAASSRWTPADLGPIAWYKGDGNAKDATGNYDGTWVGTEAYADGPTGQAFDFDADRYLRVGNISQAGHFSISAWVYVRQFAPSNGRSSLISKWPNSAGEIEYYVALQSTNGETGNVYFRYSNLASQARLTTYGTVPLGAWTHVVCVMGESQTTYINGVSVGSIFRGDTGAKQNTQPACLGALNFDWSSYVHKLDGKLDDVMLFDRALTAEEIELLYNESINKNGGAW